MNYTQYLNESNDDTQAWLQYQSRASDISKLIKELENKLKKHAARAKSQKTNYGFSGDLGYVKSELENIVGFLK
jgi:hypothetical protein